MVVNIERPPFSKSRDPPLNLVKKKLIITQKLMKLKRKYEAIVNILTANNFVARLAQAKLATKNNLAAFLKKKTKKKNRF